MSDYEAKDFLHPDEDTPISDQRRAFLEYKRRVHLHGKPFFPNAVWHDVIAATGVMALLSLQGVLSGVVGPFAWSAVVAETLLATFFSRCWARA